METLKKHAGSCHCGRVRFEILASIDHARVCDCSVCRRRGALIFRVPTEHFRLLSPWEELSEYRWGTHTGCDYFCPICGILPFRRPSAPSPEEVTAGVQTFDGWAVNLRCIDELVLEALPIVRIKGSEVRIPEE